MEIENAVNSQPVERLSVFELAGRLFGLDILRSREVLPMPKYTPLPNCEDIFCGVFNHRGEIFPLVDMSPILGLPAKQIQTDDMVILIDNLEDFVVGMLVDKIHSVLPYLAGDMKIPTGVVSRSMESYVKGILNHKRNIIHILDLKSLYHANKILAYY